MIKRLLQCYNFIFILWDAHTHVHVRAYARTHTHTHISERFLKAFGLRHQGNRPNI